MFSLDLTQSLARMGLNVLTLATVERDALVAASVLIERANTSEVPTPVDLVREANALLPSVSDNAASLRLFWATKRQQEDGPINELADLASFISERATTLEAMSGQLLKDSRSLPAWAQALARLAEGYSYVMEAALALEENGMIPLRRRNELEKLTTMPDQTTNYAGSMLFMKAMALYTDRMADRMADEKSAPGEKFA